MKKIKCQQRRSEGSRPVRVRVIKAPVVDSKELRNLLIDRARALVV